MPGIYRSGNSYGGTEQAAVAGAAPRGMPSIQNMAAAEALSARSQADSQARVMSGQPAERGWSGVIGTDPAAGRERKALVESLTTVIPGARGITSGQMRGMLGLLDQEARAAQGRANNETSLQQTQMQTGSQRDIAAMREAGDTGRLGMREIAETGRANARNGIDQGRLSLDQQVRGFDIRAGQRQEKLYQQYEAAKTPEEQAAVAKQIRDLSGKTENMKDNVMALGGGQEWDAAAGTMRNIPQRAIDLRTGREIGGAQAPAAPAGVPKAGETRNGYRFKGGNPNDQKSWEKV